MSVLFRTDGSTADTDIASSVVLLQLLVAFFHLL